MTEETCDHCKEKGVLGREIRAYRFLTAKGTPVIRYLHPSGGERRCFHAFEAKYNAYLAEQKAKANG
jgi:hypothetical protein